MHYKTSANDASLKYEDIVTSHTDVTEYPTRKYNDLEILGFVTPWNSKGRDVSIREARKGRLDIASTVSWRMNPNGPAGGHDFDDSYHEKIYDAGSKNYPRLLFEGAAWSLSSFRELAYDTKPMIRSIVELCSRHSYQGVVLELWQSLVISNAMEHYPDEMLQMVTELGEGIRKHDLHTVLVLPPYQRAVKQHGVSGESMQKLSVGFSKVIVMTYDYSVPGRTKPGPISPVNWVIGVAKFFVEECQLGKKVLLGINFYGADFVINSHENVKDRHVVGHEVVEMLRQHKPEIQWFDKWGEHGFSYKDSVEHAVFYPTQKSVGMRLGVAREIGCGGVAIWELGQGLDYFFEEF